MNKNIILIYITLFTVFTSCRSGDASSNADASNLSTAATASKIYGINSEGIVIRTGPDKKFDKLVNEKATESLGEIQYCEVDFSTKVEILERKANWAKIRVVDPEWLADTYIGWIPFKVIISQEDQQEVAKLNVSEYEILRIDHNKAVQNFDVLLKKKKFDKTYVYQFVKAFRKENCQGNCNVSVYDSKSIQSLLGIYPLQDRDYLKMADHLISISTFDALELRDWYPYQDFHYRELGGKNWK